MIEKSADAPRAAMLTQVAALGPFFAFDVHQADADADAPADAEPVAPWRRMAELVEDPGVLDARVAGVREYLAASGAQAPDAVELRVAASVTHLGLTARLVSVALAGAALDGSLWSVDLRTARWQPELGGAFPLSLPQESLRPATIGTFLDGPIRALVEAMQPFSVSSQILWGNVASAVFGATTVLTASYPAQAGNVRDVAVKFLDHPVLSGSGTVTAPRGRFRRTTCCLIYRAAPGKKGGLCGDCVLAAAR